MGDGYSNQPDERILRLLDRGERFAFVGIGLLVGLVLSLWLLPSLRDFAPSIWSKMTASTALAMGLSALSLRWSVQRSSHLQMRLSQSAAVAVLMLGVLTIAEYLTQKSFGFDVWLPHVDGGNYPGRPSPQTSIGLVMTGFSLLLIRQSKNGFSIASDLLAISLLSFVLVLIGGYLYGALELIGLDKLTLTSPHTLICFGCLTFVIAARRARYGRMLAVLVNRGIGSHLVRMLLPIALLLPFGFFAIVTYLTNARRVDSAYATAFAASAEALLIFCIVVWMAWRINSLERQLRELSLTDELTQINNRRGFYLLARHAFREAIRSESGLTVFYLDLDGLKQTNDTIGHEAGSRMIQSMAKLLAATFRGSDIVGRIGGDEFAVSVSGRNEAAAEMLSRLQVLVDDFNAFAEPGGKLRFSAGSAELPASASPSVTLDQLLEQADTMMYAQKKARQK